jgi:hypothetical protein
MYLGQMLEDQAVALTELGRFEDARWLFQEADQIRTKVGQKQDAKYAAPRLKLALATGSIDTANDLIERVYGPLADSAPISIALLRNMAARAELALLRNDGKTAVLLAHRLADRVASSHLETYLRSWQVTAAILEAQARLMQHDPSGALPLLQQATRDQAAMLDPASPARAHVEALIGIACLALGRRDNAQEQLARARAILRMHPALNEGYLRPARTLAQQLKAN